MNFNKIEQIMREVGEGGIVVKLKTFFAHKTGRTRFNAQAWVPGKEGQTCCQDGDDPVEILEKVTNEAKETWKDRFSR